MKVLHLFIPEFAVLSPSSEIFITGRTWSLISLALFKNAFIANGTNPQLILPLSLLSRTMLRKLLGVLSQWISLLAYRLATIAIPFLQLPQLAANEFDLS